MPASATTCAVSVRVGEEPSTQSAHVLVSYTRAVRAARTAQTPSASLLVHRERQLSTPTFGRRTVLFHPTLHAPFHRLPQTFAGLVARSCVRYSDPAW